MSVIKAKRNLSPIQYVATYQELYDYAEQRLAKLPKRKRPYLALPIFTIMNSIEKNIMEIFDRFYQQGIKLNTQPEQARLVIVKLMSLQKPLIALWNIEHYDEKHMRRWAELINEEIKQLAILGGLPFNSEVTYMFILDYKAIHQAKFINTISKLHELIYSKVISMPTIYRETKGSLLMDLADEALFYLCRANVNIPQTKEDYIKRKSDISIAMNRLRQMEIPLFSIFNLMHYTEENMTKIANLLSEEMKMLNKLIKSDEERFGNL